MSQEWSPTFDEINFEMHHWAVSEKLPTNNYLIFLNICLTSQMIKQFCLFIIKLIKYGMVGINHQNYATCTLYNTLRILMLHWKTSFSTLYIHVILSCVDGYFVSQDKSPKIINDWSTNFFKLVQTFMQHRLTFPFVSEHVESC